jgi:hypothetical protein
VPVFGLLKWQGKVYVAIIANARSDTPAPIIREKIRPGSVVCTDAFGSYDVLDLYGLDILVGTTASWILLETAAILASFIRGQPRSALLGP